MKTYEEKDRTITETVKELVSMKCDLCGRERKCGHWEEGAHDVKEVTVELRDGKSYPETGWATVTSFDICPDCFAGKLVPWVKSQGGEPTVKEVDW